MGVVWSGSFSQRRRLTPVAAWQQEIRRLAAIHRGVFASHGRSPVESFARPSVRADRVGRALTFRGSLDAPLLMPPSEPRMHSRRSLRALGRTVAAVQAAHLIGEGAPNNGACGNP